MVESSTLPLSGDIIAPFPVRRFTVDEYRRTGASGILTEDDRVELLEACPARVEHGTPFRKNIKDRLSHGMTRRSSAPPPSRADRASSAT
jgi:hypothetical protein